MLLRKVESRESRKRMGERREEGGEVKTMGRG
jgi:hypothetical protein